MINQNTEVEADDNKLKRYYTHSVISYATLDEIKPLLATAKHWAYICHDKDITDKHYHVLLTFHRAKSFEWVRKQVISDQNTFTTTVKGDIDDVLNYFTHEGLEGKARYNVEDIEYDDIDYWNKRRGTGEVEENKNDEFVDDLISKHYSVEYMARKYGRDYIKNWERYESARNKMLHDRDVIEAESKKTKYNEDMERKLAIINAIQW